MTARPHHVVDPVCGMTVDVANAEAAGMLVDIDGRTFAFCRSGCHRAFVEEHQLAQNTIQTGRLRRPARLITRPSRSRSSTCRPPSSPEKAGAVAPTSKPSAPSVSG